MPLSALKSAPDSESTDPPTCLGPCHCLRSRRLRSPSLLWTGARRARPPGPAPAGAGLPASSQGRRLPRARVAAPQPGPLAPPHSATGTSEEGNWPAASSRDSDFNGGHGLGRARQTRPGPTGRGAPQNGGISQGGYAPQAASASSYREQHRAGPSLPVSLQNCFAHVSAKAASTAPTCGECGVGFYLTTSSMATCICHSVSDSELCIERLCAVVAHTSR